MNVFTMVLVLVVPVLGSSSSFKELYMYSRPLCDMDERLSHGCVGLNAGVRGLIPCSLACSTEDTCIGVITDKEDNCYLSRECWILDSICSVPNPDYKHLIKRCGLRGAWLQDENRCRCGNGLVGDLCEDYPRSCLDLIVNRYSEAYHTTSLDPDGDGLNLIKTKCFIIPAFNITAFSIFSSEGKYNFNKTWMEYRNGFEFDSNNYWIGLENIHRLIKLYNLNLVWKLQFGNYGQAAVRYKNFTVTNRDLGYRHNYSGHSSLNALTFPGGVDHLGDIMRDAQNTPFSTWDMDNDGRFLENCASQTGSGWWFSTCSTRCNVFGYYPNKSSAYPQQQLLRLEGIQDLTWEDYDDQFQSIHAYLDLFV